MTKQEIRTEVMSRMNLTSADAEARVDAAIDRHHKRITSLLGMETLRLVNVGVSTVIGNRLVTVPGVEKIDRVIDVTAPTAIRVLEEISVHNMRSIDPATGAPQTWAMWSAGAAQIVVMLDSVPQVAYSLTIDGWTTRANLLPTDQPLFPASFHDVLTWFVLSEELLRKEKPQLAQAYEQKANDLLSDLRFHLADTHTRELVQGSHPGGHPGGSHPGGGGGGAPSGETSFTQTGLITFDRDPNAPFAVTPGSAVVPNLIAAQAQQATNADMLDGIDSTGYVRNPSPVDVTIQKNNGGLIIDSGVPIKGRLMSVVPSWLGMLLNARFDGTWVRDDPAATGTLCYLDSLGARFARVDENGLRVLFSVMNLTGAHLDIGRLVFPSTHNPTADPFTLDDYREGDFIPTLTASGGASGVTYLLNQGSYVKIGRVVFVDGRVALSSKGTMSGTPQIAGLPFTRGLFNTVAPLAVTLGAFAAGVHVVGLGQIPPNSTYMQLLGSFTGGTGLLDAGHVTNTSDLNFSGMYLAN